LFNLPKRRERKIESIYQHFKHIQSGALCCFYACWLFDITQLSQSWDVCENWERVEKAKRSTKNDLTFYILCIYLLYIIKSECELYLCFLFIFSLFNFTFIIMVILYSLESKLNIHYLRLKIPFEKSYNNWKCGETEMDTLGLFAHFYSDRFVGKINLIEFFE
jgi:hypothetical protein